jgi:regulatory protein
LVITKIEKQKKNSKRWNLYVDGEFACGISEDTFLNFGFRTNDEISENTLDEVKRFDEYQFAKKSALDFLAYRIRSRKEIVDKLKAKKISAETIEKTIAHIEKLGLINDEEFAKLLVQSSTGKNPSGKSVIRQKLYKKGISKDIIEKVITETFNEKKELTLVLDIFSKYKKKLAGLDKIHKRKKMFEHLARKGFDFDIINEVLNQKLKDENS